MREIKFRSWDKRNKKISYFGSFFSIEDMDSCGLIFHPKLSDDHNQGNSKDFELMQFTGLKDKNGKEIYEGDFLAYAGRDVEVVFEDSTASFKVRRGIYVSQISKMMKAQIEVIGNKFENSELLK